MKNIVILGAGFGGISVAKNLVGKVPDDFRIFLADKNDFQTFQPSLYEVATANLGKSDVPRIDFENLYSSARLKISNIFSGAHDFEFQNGEAEDVKIDEKRIYFTGGKTLDFDYLVFALGSETNFFGIPGLTDVALPLKSIGEALNIRNAIQEIFERKERHQKINIVIGGGGFTGCEFSCELVFYLKKLSKILGRAEQRFSVKIVEASDDILPGASAFVKNKARKRIGTLGVELLLGKPIVGIEESRVILKDGQKLYFDLLIWTAGVKANRILEKIQGVRLEKGCRVLVDDFLRVVPHRNIFAVGDNLYCFDPKIQAPMPATAFAAILQGKIAAQNILRQINNLPAIQCPSVPASLIIPLGGKWALAELGKVRIAGFFGWVIKELISLKYFLSVLPIWKAFRLWLLGLKVYVKND